MSMVLRGDSCLISAGSATSVEVLTIGKGDSCLTSADSAISVVLLRMEEGNSCLMVLAAGFEVLASGFEVLTAGCEVLMACFEGLLIGCWDGEASYRLRGATSWLSIQKGGLRLAVDIKMLQAGLMIGDVAGRTFVSLGVLG